MARRRNLTAEQQAERKYVMSYISEMYLEAFNEAVKISGAQTRSEYVKSLIVKDLVARGIMETMEIPRKERYLLEM